MRLCFVNACVTFFHIHYPHKVIQTCKCKTFTVASSTLSAHWGHSFYHRHLYHSLHHSSQSCENSNTLVVCFLMCSHKRMSLLREENLKSSVILRHSGCHLLGIVHDCRSRFGKIRNLTSIQRLCMCLSEHGEKRRLSQLWKMVLFQLKKKQKKQSLSVQI